jgi:hypothetical protein
MHPLTHNPTTPRFREVFEGVLLCMVPFPVLQVCTKALQITICHELLMFDVF